MTNDYNVVFQLQHEGKNVADGKLQRSDFDTEEDFCLALASQVLEAIRATNKELGGL